MTRKLLVIILILLVASVHAVMYQDQTGKKYSDEEFIKINPPKKGALWEDSKGNTYSVIEDKPKISSPTDDPANFRNHGGKIYRIDNNGNYDEVEKNDDFYVDTDGKVFNEENKEVGTLTSGGLIHIPKDIGDLKEGYYDGSDFVGSKTGEINGEMYTIDDNKRIDFINNDAMSGTQKGENLFITTTTGEGKDTHLEYSVYDSNDNKLYSGKDKVKPYDNGAFVLVDKNGKPLNKDADGNKIDEPYRLPDGSELPEGATADMNGGYYIEKDGQDIHITPQQGGSFSAVWETGSIFNTQYHFGTCNKDGSGCSGEEMDKCVFQGSSIDCSKDGKVYDCKGGTCTLSEKDFSDGFVGGYGMYWFGNQLDLWQSATSGYDNLAGLFYTDEDADNQLGILDNEWAQTILGGIDGWTSKICEGEMTDSESSGFAFSGNPSIEAFAHIEAERVKYTNYSDPQQGTFYMYKITYEIDPGEDTDHCNMEWNIYVDDTKLWSLNFDQDNYTNAVGSNAILDISTRKYNKVCIKFFSIRTGCLQGVYEGDKICNKIAKGGSNDAADFDFDCVNFASWAGGCSSDDDDSGGSGSSGDSGDSGSSSSGGRRRTDL